MRSALVGGVLLFVVLAGILMLTGLVLPHSPLGRTGNQLSGQLIIGELVCLVLLFFLAGEDERHD